jgi:hypothetical protein
MVDLSICKPVVLPILIKKMAYGNPGFFTGIKKSKNRKMFIPSC